MSLRVSPRLLTTLVVVAFGVLALVHGVAQAGFLHPVAVVFTAAWVAALLAWRRWPWTPVLVPLVLVGHGVALHAWPNESIVTMLALLLSAGLCGAGMPRSRAILAAPLWPGAVGALMLLTDYGEAGWSDLFYPGIFSLALLGGGTMVGSAARGRRTTRSQAEAAEQDLQAQRAAIAEQERGRIAQDLRALIADEIRDVRVHAIRTRALLEVGEVAAAEQALLRIEEAGRATLADLRHMLGLLRRDMTDEAMRPQPGLATLDTLVERARRCGVTAAIDVQGQPAGVNRGLEIVVFRVVELTVEQACRAGVDRIDVRIRREPDALGLEVHAHALGSLLEEEQLAIRERVVLYGGDLLIGVDARGRDVLQVRLPVPAPAPAPEVRR